ncbi:DUF2147 domain-containing protein [Sphingomonas sp. MMS12-HWE2-04]|uniref:DUF2147 domain-containing protein n=1 Tax=Sphingomonas sp. MMS12-HWE2-04 TaxID=3234199 RepID=UPI00384F4D5B
MTRLARLVLPLLAAAALTGAAEAPSHVWANPSKSVHIRFEPCGVNVCGTVIWASEKAIADTRKGGGADLVGTQIFRNLRQVRPNMWKGKVFVPDIRKTFGGTVTLVGDDRLVGKGCLILGVGCKSQVWTRVAD